MGTPGDRRDRTYRDTISGALQDPLSGTQLRVPGGRAQFRATVPAGPWHGERLAQVMRTARKSLTLVRVGPVIT